MKLWLACILALALASPLLAQRRIGHDPLNPVETDQLRDTAQEPNRRLKLYVGFARARLTSIDQVLADPKAKDRAKQLHDLLEDFAALADEIADNVDTYHGEHWDMRKSLKLVIEGDSEFQVKLKQLSQTLTGPDAPPDVDQYKFVLQDALESLNNNAGDARKIMQEQNVLAKEKKLKKEDQ
jgi:hypothetical protein